jgi:protein MpaA
VGWALAGCCLLSVLMGEPKEVRIGESLERRPILSYTLGDGPAALLVIGGIHGAPEINSSALVWQLLTYFAEEPDAMPEGVSLVFVPEVNPDGIANDTRELADGVDPNRNWPTEDWSPDSYAPGGRRLEGGGGEAPLSEPETIALAEFIERTRPISILSYHSAAGIAMGGPAAERSGLLAAFIAAAGYPARKFVAYPVSGDFAQWCDELDIPTVEVELTDHTDPEVDRNLAGIAALLQMILEKDDQSY